jgi:hypothetical protein
LRGVTLLLAGLAILGLEKCPTLYVQVLFIFSELELKLSGTVSHLIWRGGTARSGSSRLALGTLLSAAEL